MFMSLPYQAFAGPPFLTDDPEPTATGHWEIYAPLLEAQGRGASLEGAAGVELNYGAAHNLQLTLGLSSAFTHDAGRWSWGAGDVEMSAKYRFFYDESDGLSIAAFPGMTLPTGSNGMSAHKVTALLPIWAQKNMGRWAIFGGGGYAVNPGVGNRDYWTGGVAVTRSFGDRLLIGMEADQRGADITGGSASTSIGLGAIYQLKAPLRVLASGGPTFADTGGKAGFHAFAALGVDF
ncbi:hypothetical protein [Rhizorhabdus argentea]|uniref:hypothetical protein n=1 Tax=Rhizorhabdus argentea TaxID=1387174 RepID=UPI0030EF4F1A